MLILMIEISDENVMSTLKNITFHSKLIYELHIEIHRCYPVQEMIENTSRYIFMIEIKSIPHPCVSWPSSLFQRG